MAVLGNRDAWSTAGDPAGVGYIARRSPAEAGWPEIPPQLFERVLYQVGPHDLDRVVSGFPGRFGISGHVVPARRFRPADEMQNVSKGFVCVVSSNQ
jgi:hypothetical protein